MLELVTLWYLPHLLNIVKERPLLHNSGQPPIKCWRVSSTYDYKQLSLNGFSEIALYPCTTIGWITTIAIWGSRHILMDISYPFVCSQALSFKSLGIKMRKKI